jgi:hypothetical protein
MYDNEHKFNVRTNDRDNFILFFYFFLFYQNIRARPFFKLIHETDRILYSSRMSRKYILQ